LVTYVWIVIEALAEVCAGSAPFALPAMSTAMVGLIAVSHGGYLVGKILNCGGFRQRLVYWLRTLGVRDQSRVPHGHDRDGLAWSTVHLVGSDSVSFVLHVGAGPVSVPCRCCLKADDSSRR